MRIKIAQRFRPFSHTPGTAVLLPGSSLEMQIFPALVVVRDLGGVQPKFIDSFPVEIKGPVKDFTVMQNLEKGCIDVWGKAESGYFRYKIGASKQKGYALDAEAEYKPHLMDRLALGNHKQQDWDLICRRLDMTEIFPIWHRLGQMVEGSALKKSTGTAAFLKQCENTLDLKAFKTLFLAAFQGILSPRLEDERHLGFDLLPLAKDETGSPLDLLIQGSKLIRSLFVRSDESRVHILPALPPEFHAGRMLDVVAPFGTLDIEWSKKTLRRMFIHAIKDETVELILQKKIKRFRFQGKEVAVGTPLDFKQGTVYFFDNFQS